MQVNFITNIVMCLTSQLRGGGNMMSLMMMIWLKMEYCKTHSVMIRLISPVSQPLPQYFIAIVWLV